MWNKTQFEEHIEERLIAELGEDKGASMFADYVTTRDKLVDNIFKEIKGVEPDLSDHDAGHIVDVLCSYSIERNIAAHYIQH